MLLLNKQKGITILEVLLVLALGTSITLLTLKMYRSYKIEQAFDVLAGNVDNLFQAMGSYYKANCSSGSLASTTTPVTVTIATLQSGGYLTSWSPNNPLVDNTSGYTNAYYLQYNLVGTAVSQVSSNACTSASNKPCSTFTAQALPLARAGALTWVAQVAVKLSSSYSANAASYMGRLAAQCVSSLSGATVASCTPTPTANGYLVWNRLPSFSSPSITSSLWPSTPMLKQFQLQYTHDQMYELNSGGTGIQYYTCGG